MERSYASCSEVAPTADQTPDYCWSDTADTLTVSLGGQSTALVHESDPTGTCTAYCSVPWLAFYNGVGATNAELGAAIHPAATVKPSWEPSWAPTNPGPIFGPGFPDYWIRESDVTVTLKLADIPKFLRLIPEDEPKFDKPGTPLNFAALVGRPGQAGTCMAMVGGLTCSALSVLFGSTSTNPPKRQGTFAPGMFTLPGESQGLGEAESGDRKVSITFSAAMIYARNGHVYASVGVGFEFPADEETGVSGSVSVRAGYIQSPECWHYTADDIDHELIGLSTAQGASLGSMSLSVSKALPDGNIAVEYGEVEPPSDSLSMSVSYSRTWLVP